MSKAKIVVVVLLGPPGSGKGTQAKILSSKHPRWLHISTGDLFRKEIASGSKLGANLKETLSKGLLVEDKLTNSVFESQLKLLVSSQNPELLMLDGWPRNKFQCEYLLKLVQEGKYALGRPQVVEVSVPLETLISRLSGRRLNPRTGRIYHDVSNPPQKAGICDDDGGPLVQRDDDKPQVIRDRYKSQFEEPRGPLLSVLMSSQEAKPVLVDGTAPIEQVSANLEKIFMKFLSEKEK
jgi:adenylate kinase